MPSGVGDAIGGVATGAADVEAANITAKGNLAAQQSAAAAAQAQAQQAFQEQTGYINQSEANQRAAMTGVQNPALDVKSLMTAPTKTQMAPTAAPTSVGGQVYSGGSGTPQMSQADLASLLGSLNGGGGGGGGDGMLASAGQRFTQPVARSAAAP